MSLLKELTAVDSWKLEPIGNDFRGIFHWGKVWHLPISKASLRCELLCFEMSCMFCGQFGDIHKCLSYTCDSYLLETLASCHKVRLRSYPALCTEEDNEKARQRKRKERKNEKEVHSSRHL